MMMMMKKRTGIIAGVAVLLLIAGIALFFRYTKSHSPIVTTTYAPAGGPTVAVTYCQPYKKGRVIFGEKSSGALQPYGKYWRVGANAATVFDVSSDILVNGKELKAGKYQLYAIPGQDTWQVIFNSDWDRWGANEADHETDILSAEVAADNNAPAEEQLRISFTDADSTGHFNMVIHWDKTSVAVPMASK
jgi:hypothetical protein